MADKQIKQYTEYTTPVAGDWFLSQKASTDETVKVAAENVVPDGAVTPEKILAGAGTTWAWATWTPSWTNLTVGNGTVVANYTQVGKTIFARIKFTMGTTSSMGSTPTFTLPVTAIGTLSIYTRVGLAYIEDAGLNGFEGVTMILSATTATVSGMTSATTYVQPSGITSTVPFTWGTSDLFIGTLCYEAA